MSWNAHRARSVRDQNRLDSEVEIVYKYTRITRPLGDRKAVPHRHGFRPAPDRGARGMATLPRSISTAQNLGGEFCAVGRSPKIIAVRYRRMALLWVKPQQSAEIGSALC